MSSASDIFTPHSLTIKQLFNNADALYQIPRYQRPYKWSDEQVEKLWDDITEAYENNTESYFLGSIITAAPKENSSYRDVVDGQQRLTTLMILFAVVRDLCPDLNATEGADPQVVKQRVIKQAIVADEEFNRLKLYTHIQHQTDFEQLIVNANTSLIEKPKKALLQQDESPKYKFLNTAAIFKAKIAERSPAYIGALMNYLFNAVRVIRIDCSSKEFAIKLFQVLNDRGLDLSSADLIKSFLIQNIEAKYGQQPDLLAIKENHFMQEWNAIEQTIAPFNDHLNDVFVLYLYYCLGSNPKRSVYDELSTVFKSQDPLMVIADIKQFVSHYKQHLWEASDEHIYALWYLRWQSYWKSILLTAYQTNYTHAQALPKLLKRFYYLNWIAGKTLSSVKQTSFNLIAEIKKGSAIEAIQALVEQQLSTHHVMPLALEALKGDLYKESWCKALFCMLEYNASDKSKLLFIPHTQDLHLEHIVPNKYANFTEWQHISPELFAKWGQSAANLTLLSGSKNIEASDNPFHIKIDVYKGLGLHQHKNDKVTAFMITQSIVKAYDQGTYQKTWNQEAILDRWHWFCKEVSEILDINIQPE
jgi:uncharacterized protein with ParB-like and HNH nuclease domain